VNLAAKLVQLLGRPRLESLKMVHHVQNKQRAS
jgi:hypothetical protein